MSKFSFKEFLIELSSTEIEELPPEEMQKLARMSPEQRQREIEKTQRARKMDREVSPRLQQLYRQLERIKQLITQEKQKQLAKAGVTQQTQENLDDLEELKQLTEASIRQFKRIGSTVKRQYRCTSGKKKGKMVASPQQCAKRKDPKKVRHGRKVARTKKGIRVLKSRISKRKSLSKLVKRLNQRLSGKT